MIYLITLCMKSMSTTSEHFRISRIANAARLLELFVSFKLVLTDAVDFASFYCFGFYFFLLFPALTIANTSHNAEDQDKTSENRSQNDKNIHLRMLTSLLCLSIILV